MFSALPEKALKKICAIAKFERAGKKDIVFSEGQPVRGFYVILSGQVRLFKTGPNGRMQILHILGAPSSFAEALLFIPRYPATAQATKKTQLAFISTRSFEKLARSDIQVVLAVIASMGRWLKHTTDLIENLTLKNVSERLAGYVLALNAEKSGARTAPLTSPLSKTALAGLLGTTKETLSRTLKKFSHSKILLFRSSKIAILDRRKLEGIARSTTKL